MYSTNHLSNIKVSLKKLKILLVDDSIPILNKMKEILCEVKCIDTLDFATNAFKAYQMIDAEPPHLVLLDINMPGKNGVELLKEIKQNHPNVKVMMVTNQSVDYYKPICAELGADYFIDKSTEFEMIPEIIENVCAEMSN
ncbi:MAG: response regulator [Pedobacter sp.]|nr:response regulator [Chitinophagaceae bacterium]